MSCNGICVLCSSPCFRGEKSIETPVIKKDLTTETSLVVVESAGEYELTKSLFGKDKVRRVK